MGTGIEILISIIGFVTTVAGFLFGRLSAANAAGKRDGSIDTKLEYLKTSLDEIKEELKEFNLGAVKETLNNHSKSLAGHDDSIKRIHERLDKICQGNT